MKAKEYAAQYHEKLAADPNKTRAAWEIARDMLVEGRALMLQRSQSQRPSNTCITGVLNEQTDKWKAFVRIVGDGAIRPDGFARLIEHEFADIWPELISAGYKYFTPESS
jgi:hypothetical protein